MKFLDTTGLAYFWAKIRTALDAKQDVLSGTAGKLVGFDAQGRATAITAEYVTEREMNTAIAEAAESVKDMLMSGGVPYGKELSESWPALQARIRKGDFTGIHIGDYKTITVNGETVVMEVAGIDQYTRCDPKEIGHHVDFISRDCLNGLRKFNNTETNNGNAEEDNPWRASDLFKYLNETVFKQLDAALQSCIIEKRAYIETKYSSASPGELTSDTGAKWDSVGRLWLPTEIEVFGTAHCSEICYGTYGGGQNIQYPIFMGGARHIIKGKGHNGTRTSWWESVTKRESATNVCSVHFHGTFGSYAATNENGVPLCFRIG